MAFQPVNDSKGVIIDKLGENQARFEMSCLNLKNAKGLDAIREIEQLRAEFLNFARDPTLGQEQLGPKKPKQPDISNLDKEAADHEMSNYYALLDAWILGQEALSMQVPSSDMYAIEQFLKPYYDMLYATPAVKSMRFKMLTKDVREDQGGFLGFGKKQQPQ